MFAHFPLLWFIYVPPQDQCPQMPLLHWRSQGHPMAPCFVLETICNWASPWPQCPEGDGKAIPCPSSPLGNEVAAAKWQ